jgi:hypothetical protein
VPARLDPPYRLEHPAPIHHSCQKQEKFKGQTDSYASFVDLGSIRKRSVWPEINMCASTTI